MIVLEREDLGMVLHTSLRKFCDSSATTIAYNAIQHLDEKIWGVYLDILWEELNKIEAPSEADVGKISAKIDDSYIYKYPAADDVFEFLRNDHVQQSLYYILMSSFKLFNEEDWANYAYYVFNDS